jgi:HlyD family secretion protein
MNVPRVERRLVVAAAVALATTLAGCRSSAPKDPLYETAAVTRGALTQYVTASGTLSAVVSVDVGSQVSGKITALTVDFNSPVRKGQLVAEIDSTLYAATLRQAKGELASARANVTLKRQNLERKRALVPERAASQFDLDQATAELAQAEATVIIREANVQSAQANLDFCKITAPVNGTVIARKVDIGQTVIAAMNTPVLLTVAQNLREMNINASISEADVGQVRVGQTVDFTVDAFPDETFQGKVTQIRKSPMTTQNVVTYECIIAVPNPDEKLFPGMTADVSVRVADRADALVVSNTALRFVPPAGTVFEQAPPTRLERTQRLVYVPSADGQRLKAVVVRTGITDGVSTEIVEGVTAPMRVVTSARTSEAKSGGFPPPPGQ